MCAVHMTDDSWCFAVGVVEARCMWLFQCFQCLHLQMSACECSMFKFACCVARVANGLLVCFNVLHLFAVGSPRWFSLSLSLSSSTPSSSLACLAAPIAASSHCCVCPFHMLKLWWLRCAAVPAAEVLCSHLGTALPAVAVAVSAPERPPPLPQPIVAARWFAMRFPGWRVSSPGA